MIWAGPYCGEFGFEIMTWQANVRRRAKDERVNVVVGCKAASRPLYSDFTDKFWDVPSGTHATENTSGCRRCDGGEKDITRTFKKAMPSKATHMAVGILRPEDGTFIRYGQKRSSSTYDVVIHARYMVKGTKGGDLRRSTPQEWWDELSEAIAGMSVACIGLKSCSLTLPMAADLRGIPLNQTMDILASSRCIVGPTSGPMHLATLCKCPLVVWTDTNHVAAYDKTSNVVKLERTWNPFGTPTRIHHTSQHAHQKKYWMPDLTWVQKNIRELVNGPHHPDT